MLVRMVVLTMMTLIGVVQSRTWSCPSLFLRRGYSLPISLGQLIEVSSSAYDSQRKQWIVENRLDAHPDHAFKIVARDIALDYCNLPISKNLQSVLTPTLSGGDALDRIDESIW